MELVEKYYQKGYHVYVTNFKRLGGTHKDTIYEDYESALKSYDRACINQRKKLSEGSLDGGLVQLIYRPISNTHRDCSNDFLFSNDIEEIKLYPKMQYRDVSKDTPISKRELVL